MHGLLVPTSVVSALVFVCKVTQNQVLKLPPRLLASSSMSNDRTVQHPVTKSFHLEISPICPSLMPERFFRPIYVAYDLFPCLADPYQQSRFIILGLMLLQSLTSI